LTASPKKTRSGAGATKAHGQGEGEMSKLFRALLILTSLVVILAAVRRKPRKVCPSWPNSERLAVEWGKGNETTQSFDHSPLRNYLLAIHGLGAGFLQNGGSKYRGWA
jgi:hypothetical protein